jgi:hypothetical protein
MNQIVSYKSKKKFKLNSDNTRRVLDVFFREPEKRFEYKDLRVILGGSESQIRDALRGLTRLNILEARGLTGRPRKEEEKKKEYEKRKEYKIIIDAEVFKIITNSLPDDKVEAFLESNYVNHLIKNKGFIEIYNNIYDRLERSQFRESASRALLHQSALVDEYKNYKNFIRTQLECACYQTIIPNIREDHKDIGAAPIKNYNLFEPLSHLNLLDSITFYRKEINNIYIKYYRHLMRDWQFSAGAMGKYADLDIFLSPLTSYPVNDPIHLLFAKPFERLYDDVYIIENADYYKMIKRAYIVYSRFSEILYSGIYYLRWEKLNYLDWKLIENDDRIDREDRGWYREELEEHGKFLSLEMDSLSDTKSYLDNLTKNAIFYWNEVSRRLDTLFDELNRLREEDKNGKYHIFSDNNKLKIVDLVSNQYLVSGDTNRDLTNPYFLLDISAGEFDNRYSNLYPCNIFYDNGMKLEERTYDDILPELKQKFERHFN